MEAAEETLTYRDDTGLHRKLLPEDKERDGKGRAETHSDESNYVDLDMKPDGAKTVKVTFTGDGNQLSVIKSDGARQGERPEETRLEAAGAVRNGGAPDAEAQQQQQQLPVPVPVPAELDPSDCSDELQYTDMYLHSRAESDDGASAVLSDHCGSDVVEDESHYITTHEIQLTELDHDVDYDLGRGTCWDFEDDNLVYSFVDYASFESDDTQEEGTLIVEGRSQATLRANLCAEPDESDLCDSDKCASSDESVCKHLAGGDATNVGEIHVSIKTASRAVKEPVDSFDSSTCEYSKNFGDRGHFSFVSSGARAGPLCDRAQYFIPAPGRQHLATKLRRKDINEYSSGASSSISELDDADKEVRNLTAKSFRSLACPYFDAINLSTSSESSMSEYGLNKWSAYVDWNYGKISRGKERSVIARKTSSATVEMNKTVEGRRHAKAVGGTKAQQIKMSPVNKRAPSQHAPSPGQKPESRDALHPKQRGVTLNFRCVGAPAGARRPKCSKNPRSGEVMGTVLTRSGCEMQYHHVDGMGDSQKRAIFASSLLKNVISKKMQFEQERKMERGEIRDTYPAPSPCFQFKEQDRGAGRGLQRQNSESGSAYTVNSADDQPSESSRPSSCEPEERERGNKAPDDPEKEQHNKESSECPKAQLSQSQSSAFNSWKEDEPGKEVELPASDAQATKETAAKELDTNSMLTKLLFVPSCQRLSKEKECTDASTHAPVTGAPAGPQKCEKVFKTGNSGNIVDKAEKEEKTPEIKICLRSVKESKGCTLNIANLLTPKISSNTVNTFRAAGEAKCHILSASDKIPNFTVRDIRDTKCKFQAPIYHVRDVRKLVKSSYRFVSLDNSDGKASGTPLTPADKAEEKVKKEQEKQSLPSPIVIKCQSVKTNGKSQIKEASQKQTEAEVQVEASQSDNTQSHCTAGRGPPLAVKPVNPDQSETQTAAEKLLRQRLEKFSGEPKIPKQAALEKLKAAVKTMEQLYVFDRNEWKRKAQPPQPITDSHVLSLIASEELEPGAGRLTDGDPALMNNGERGKEQEVAAGSLNIIHVPYNYDAFKTQSQQSKTFSNQSVLHLGNTGKARVSISSVLGPQSTAVQTSSSLKSTRTPVTPLSVKIGPPKHAQAEQRKVKVSPTQPHPAGQDSENYLTIPGLGFTNEIKVSREPVSKETNSTVNHADDRNVPEQKRSPLIMEYPSSSIYHQPAQTQQVLRFSPSAAAVSPTPSAGETGPQTQRKMLLDPTTGHYYLVDTPIQPTTKRLFDPETGQYVDVPVPGSPVAPATPVTPVPLSLSPLALGPAAYAPTYMIYPGFIPSPTLSAQALLPQSPCHSEEDKSARSPKQDAAGAESTYFTATRETPKGPLQLPVGAGHAGGRGGAVSSDRKPIISITTQQGPRIIAPPSFDGTTMSFVVEHR